MACHGKWVNPGKRWWLAGEIAVGCLPFAVELPWHAVGLAIFRGACRRAPWKLPSRCRRTCRGSRAVVCHGKCHGHCAGCHVLPWQFRGLPWALPRHTAKKYLSAYPFRSGQPFLAYPLRQKTDLYQVVNRYSRLDPRTERRSMPSRRAPSSILRHIFSILLYYRQLVCVGRVRPKTEVIGAGPELFCAEMISLPVVA